MSFIVRYRCLHRHQCQPCWHRWPLRCEETKLRDFTPWSVSLVFEAMLRWGGGGGGASIRHGAFIRGESDGHLIVYFRLLDLY